MDGPDRPKRASPQPYRVVWVHRSLWGNTHATTLGQRPCRMRSKLRLVSSVRVSGVPIYGSNWDPRVEVTLAYDENVQILLVAQEPRCHDNWIKEENHVFERSAKASLITFSTLAMVSLVARTFISAILETWTRDPLRHRLADTALAAQPTPEELPRRDSKGRVRSAPAVEVVDRAVALAHGIGVLDGLGDESLGLDH